MNIFIVGLGLIGGSLAKSLKGFKNAEIYGINRTRRYLDSAEKEGVIKKGYTVDEAEAIKEADIIILCLYPSLNVEFIKKTGEYLKQGAVITDVSGVKTYIEEEMAKILPPGVDFVGGHPMAGREVTSYENSSADLFENTSYLVVPSKTSKEENVRLIEEMARYAGASRVVRTNAENHDEIIAYTSQLMHVVAAAICNIPTAEKAEGYAGGSIRDATRVANINETLWSELFLENAPALINAIDNMQAALGDFRSAIEKGDRKETERLMISARERKLKRLGGNK